MATESIEDIVVKLEVDYSTFLKQIDQATNEAVNKLKGVDEAPKKAKSAWADLGGFLKSQFLPIAASITAAFALQNVFGGVISFVQNLGKAAVDTGAQMETMQVQFETLLGSATAAKERVSELIKFADFTPFETDEVIEADRLLQTFGGTALATGENLRRVGDSAAAVNANFQEVAFWTGRLYAAVQAGRPFGEAAARLSELGILSGDTRTKMEDLQKAGVDGAEIWELYASTVDTKFAGAMEKLAKTFQGVMSNIRAFQDMLLREGGASFFEGLRQDAVDFYDAINKPDVKKPLVDIAKAAGDLAEILRNAVTSPLIEGLKDIDPQSLENLSASLDDFAESVGRLISSDAQTDIGTILDLITTLVDATTILINDLNKVKGAVAAGGQALMGFLNPLSNIPAGLVAFDDALKKITGHSLADFTRGIVNFQETVQGISDNMDGLKTTGSHALNALQKGAQLATDRAKELAGAVEEVDEAAVAAAGALDKISLDFADAVDANNEKIEELNIDHNKKMAEIDSDLTDKQIEIGKDRADALVDLDKELGERRQKINDDTDKALLKLDEETAEKRQEILDKTKDDLSKLESDTNESIDKLRQEAHDKEERETQDHQRDMQRLQDQYIFDLQDAVKNRDARAIVDLRRRFQKEKQERESDFDEKKKDEGKDLENRIKEIRATERERRNEILDGQKKALSDLDKHETKRRNGILESKKLELAELQKYEDDKRLSIDESYNEQMAKAQAAHDEQITRENENYAERATALNEALQKRLEDVAKELSDEKDINEEGAKAILETLNDYFGVGGNIDELMEEFAARRKQKMTIRIGFENEMAGLDDTDVGTPNQRGSMGPPRFQLGGIVPGPIGKPKRIIAHGGEEIIPVNEVARLNQMRQGLSAGGGEMRVKLDISGSAPPGIRSGEVDAIAGVLVNALKSAGINARR